MIISSNRCGADFSQCLAVIVTFGRRVDHGSGAPWKSYGVMILSDHLKLPNPPPSLAFC